MAVKNGTLRHRYLKPQVIFVLALSLLIFFGLNQNKGLQIKRLLRRGTELPWTVAQLYNGLPPILTAQVPVSPEQRQGTS